MGGVTPSAAGVAEKRVADAPARVADAVPGWRGAAVPAVVIPVRGQRRLVPETIFTVEDGVGDVTGVRIRVPADPPQDR